MLLESLNIPLTQGRHFILICGGVQGAEPLAGVQGTEPLGGGQGAKPQRFWHFKSVPDMYFCG